MDLEALKKRLSVAIETPQQPTSFPKFDTPDWDTLIDKYSSKYPDVPKERVKAILMQESGGDPNAIGKETKYGTAKGGFQFIDSTARENIPGWQSPEDSLNPEKSTEGAFIYLDKLIKQSGGDINKATQRYFGAGVDPVLGMSTEEYAKQVEARESGNTSDSGIQKKGTGDLSGLKDRLKSAMASGNTFESYQAPINQTPAANSVQPQQDIPAVGQPQAAPVEQKKQGFLSDVGNALASGAATMTGSFYSAPGAVTGVLASATNLLNKGINAITGRKLLKEDYQTPEILIYKKAFDVAKESSDKIGIKKEGNLLDFASKGDVLKAGQYLGTWVAEQAPQQVMNAGMIMMGVPSAITLTLMGLETAGAKEAETKELVKSGKIAQEQASLAAIGAGTAEAVFEKYGDVPVFEALKKSFGKKVAEVGLDKAKETLFKTFQKVFKGFIGAANKEVPSEVATTIAQDLTDKITGVNPDITFESMLNNVVETAAGTLVMSGAPGMITGFNESQNIRQQQKGIEETQQKLESDPQFMQAIGRPTFTETVEPSVTGVKEKVQELQMPTEYYEDLRNKVQNMQENPEEIKPVGLQEQQPEIKNTPRQEPGIYTEKPGSKPVLRSIVERTEQDAKERTDAIRYAYEVMGVKSVDEFAALPEDQQAAAFNKLDDLATPKNEQAQKALLEFTRVLDLKESQKVEQQKAEEKPAEQKPVENPEEDYTGKVVTFKGPEKKYQGKDVSKEYVGTIIGSTSSGNIVKVSVKDNAGNERVHNVPVKRIMEMDGVETIPEKIIIPKKEEQQEPAIKEVLPTDEQKKKGSEIIKGIENVEFQGINSGLSGTNPKTGKTVDIKPTFEFKDKVSGGNFTLSEDQVTPENINKILEEKRKTIPQEEKDAKTVRSNAGQVQGRGNVGENGKNKSSEDLQRNEKTGRAETEKQASGKITDVSKAQTVEEQITAPLSSPDKTGEVEKSIYDNMFKFLEKSAKDRGVEVSDKEKTELQESAKRQAKTIYDAVTNKDIGELEARLSNLSNKGSRKGFEIITGVTLPNTVNGTTEEIRKFVGEENYDSFKNQAKEARIKKEAEEKQRKYTEERDKLLDAKITYNGKPTTYRGLIDGRINDGWKVEVEKRGIREIYRLTDGKNSVTLPKKMMGEYAEEKTGKVEKKVKDEWTTLNEELTNVTNKIKKEKQFNKQIKLNNQRKEIVEKIKALGESPSPEKIIKGDEILFDISGKGNFAKGKVMDETEDTYTIKTTSGNFIFKTKDLVKPDPDFKRSVEELDRKNADTDVKLPGYEDRNFAARKREGFWWLYDKDSNEMVYGGDEFPFPSKESLIEYASENYKPKKEKADEKEVSQKTETVLNKEVETPSSDANTNLVNDYLQLIKTHHGSSERIPNTRRILDLADKAHGGTIAEGKYGIRDAYDALETAMNKYVEESGFGESPKETIKKLNTAIKVLPTQTVRTEDQIEKQQFSTPPSEAYVAVLASGIQPGMTGLEPSAGDGNIATIMRMANKGDGTIHTNEIDERRRNNLKVLGFNPTDADAEYLHSTLPKEVRPDVVVMNPPFSATGGRLKQHDTGFGAEHVRQALLRLNDGGRLVAIVGRGMAFGKPKMASWWNSIRDKYNVRANIGISGKEYEKYGTGFDNNIIVIDKTGKTGSIENIITGSDLTVEQAYDLLEPLTKEDVNGRIKRDSAGGSEEVVSKKPEGETTKGKSGVGPVDTPPVGSGRGSSKTGRTGTDKTAVESMGKSGEQLPGEGGISDNKQVTEGSETGGTAKTEQTGNESVVPESGNDDTGRPERKPARQERVEEDAGSVYSSYSVKKATYPGSVPHQANIVESTTMASVDLPNVTYKLSIPKEMIKKGAPSDIQLEAATYAGQAHEQRLPDGRRKEYLIGDNTGTGKTITILTTIYDNWMKGRKKSVVITKSKGLIKDLRDDMKMMGIDIPVIDLSEYKMTEDVTIPEGILFSTYATASGNWIKGRERYNQILRWFGKDNDGVFVFDEAHMMKNASAEKPTNTGSMGIKFKDELRNARFLNASATAATNSKNLAYLTRMGLWGEGSPFKNFTEFLGTMSQGGLGAMELLSRDMKSNGNYISRTISYKGVDYETLNHTMNESEIASYNSMADFWSEILQNMDEAAKNSGLKGRAARNHAKQYYAAQQRFFLQLMVSFQVETMLKDADQKLKDGKSVVISLFNTNEQQTEKKVGDAQAQGIDIDDMDFTPRDMMVDMIKNNFPVYQYQEIQRDDGTKEYVQVKDKAGNPLKNAENEAIMNELVDKVATFKMPDNPLDRIVNYFGEGKVSEVTGRKKRLVMVNGKKVYKARATKDVSAKDINRNELDQFMDGKKRVAVLSGAAATGFSFHASTKKKNQQRRVFYALQLSWSADQQMQAFGRVHRTMQASAPEIVLVQTDIASQKRLVNTIQSRLASLGAISKGERESLSGGIFSIEDITDEYGEAALRDTLSKMNLDTLQRMGLVTEKGQTKDVDVDGFLNRLMVLQVKDQNEIFDKFYGKYRDAVDKAKEAGTYDTGVEKIKGDNVRIEGEPILLSDDKQSGVKTEIYNIAHDAESVRYTFKQANDRLSNKKVSYVKNKRSGEPYMAYVQESDVHVLGPRWASKKIPYTQVKEDFYDKYEKVSDEKEFEKMWSDKYKEIPKITTQHTHIITGSIFNNYKKIFEASAEGAFSKLKVYRAALDDGTSKIGVYVPQSMIEKIKQNFGIGTDLATASPQKIIDLVKGGSIIEFDNRWKLKKSKVMGDERIELNIGNEYNTGYIEKMGLFNEIIAGQKRYFVPTGDSMMETVKNIMEKTKPVRDLTVNSQESVMASAPDNPNIYAASPVSVLNLSNRVTPNPVPMNPVQSVKNAPSGKKMKYAQASNSIGKHIAAKESKSKNGDEFLNAQERWYQKWVDLSWPITKIADIYDKDMDIPKESVREIDTAIDLVRGAGGMAAQFINDNLKPIFDAFKKNKGETYSELNKYLVAKRSAWLYENKKNYIDMGISKDNADTFIEFIETGAHPYSTEIQEAAGKIWDYGKKVLYIKKDHGIIDDFMMANLTEPYYVPFYRDIESERIAGNVPRGERFTSVSKGIKRIKGSLSGKQIVDPIQNLMEHTYETMVNASRADVTNMLIDMAEKSETLGEMFQKVDPKWVKVGTIEHRGTMDVLLRPQIDELAKDLGITTEYKTKLAARIGRKLQKVLGKYGEGGKLQLLVGATEETYAHELGHGIHEKYSWYDSMVERYDSELNAVADTRHTGVEVPASFVSYCRSKSEKAAEFISMYVTDRESLQKLVPKMVAEFEGKIQKDETLKKLIPMKPSNVRGLVTKEENNFVLDWHIPQDKDVVSVLRDGKVVSYRVPIELADAIKNLHPAMFPAWFKILTIPNRILRRGAVSMNIDFMFPNSFRDQQESAINARSIPVVDALIGLKEYISNGDWMKRYLRSGGGMESVEAGTRGFAANAEELKYGSKYGKYLDPYFWQETGALRGTGSFLWDAVKAPFKTIELMGEASEMATRIGTFRRAQVGVPQWLEWYSGKKKTEAQAMHIARQATIDFQRFGSYGRTLNEVVPFINAAIQGTDKMVRSFKDDYKRAILATMIYAYAPMIALWLWNRDKELYKAIPLQEKLNNFIIMALDGKTYFKIPKGHITKFLVNPAQVIIEKLNGTITKNDLPTAMQMLDDLSPVDISSIPVSLRLIIEPIANFDLYWKKEIETPAMKGIAQAGERSDNRTSQTIKMIGKALNISPAMMQHEVELMGAGTAKNTLWLADNILVMAGISDGSVDAKKFGVERAPVARRFYGKVTEWGSDVDAAIRDINTELSKMNKTTYYQLNKRLKYSPEKIKNIKQSNQRKSNLLLSKRSELMKAKEAILEILRKQE